MESPNSTHHGLIITRSAQWSKETCRIIAKHFLLPFRIALSVNKPLGVLPLLQSQLESSLQPILARNLQGTRLGTVCATPHIWVTFSPRCRITFFLCLCGKKCRIRFRVARQPSLRPALVIPHFFLLFRGGSLKCSHIWQISIITPRTRSCCASIFVIYSWWYCTKYIRLPFYTPSEDSVFFFIFIFTPLSVPFANSAFNSSMLFNSGQSAAHVPCRPVVLFPRFPPQKKKQPFHPLLRRREWLSILESSGLRRGDSGETTRGKSL